MGEQHDAALGADGDGVAAQVVEGGVEVDFGRGVGVAVLFLEGESRRRVADGAGGQTFSKNVSGRFGLKISLHVITVTKSSVSERLTMLCVQPGII